MYCDYYEEGGRDCEDCGRRGRCEQYSEIEEKKIDKTKLMDTEFAKSVREQFKKVISVDDERMDTIIIELTEKAFNVSLKQVQNCVKEMAEIEAVKYITGRAKPILDGYFEAALNDEIRVLSTDKQAVTTKISTILLGKAKKFFSASSNTRSYTDDSIDKVIHNVVEEKIDVALKELKEECIEKFNKDILKTMMKNMVGAIGADKRLMAVINTESK